jgi:hypothetical protein
VVDRVALLDELVVDADSAPVEQAARRMSRQPSTANLRAGLRMGLLVLRRSAHRPTTGKVCPIAGFPPRDAQVPYRETG